MSPVTYRCPLWLDLRVLRAERNPEMRTCQHAGNPIISLLSERHEYDLTRFVRSFTPWSREALIVMA